MNPLVDAEWTESIRVHFTTVKQAKEQLVEGLFWAHSSSSCSSKQVVFLRMLPRAIDERCQHAVEAWKKNCGDCHHQTPPFQQQGITDTAIKPLTIWVRRSHNNRTHGLNTEDPKFNLWNVNEKHPGRWDGKYSCLNSRELLPRNPRLRGPIVLIKDTSVHSHLCKLYCKVKKQFQHNTVTQLSRIIIFVG